MADEPRGFDAANLEGLAKIKAEQQSLHELAQRAAEYREKITEVYNRVVRDYEARIRGLEEQARKLRLQLKDEFDRLEGEFGQARQALDQARFDLQESEFRKEIGEYSAEEFRRRQGAIDATISEKQREVERIAQLRTRFLELLSDPGAPVAPVVIPPAGVPAQPAPVAAGAVPTAALPATATLGAPPPAPAVVPLPTPQPIVTPAARQPSPGASVAPAGKPAPPPPPSVPVPPPAPVAAGIGETMVLPPPGSAVFKMPSLPTGGDEGATQILASPATGAEAAEAFATVALPAGALIEEKEGIGPVTHRLSVLTTIGRTPDNQIVIASREVSRKHSEILLGPGGYLLRDLGSPNGTFVNGKKVTEHRLQEGDKITIAGAAFVFKAR